MREEAPESECRYAECVELYFISPIRLHTVALYETQGQFTFQHGIGHVGHLIGAEVLKLMSTFLQ